ncbi:flavin reductase family protein [Solwaraspora sp. WMMD1047]|uniref:flavin reductase family protein n=1 Tax=Solwaraspora sp. WMMD1047 TaxID=3016102 RepID=UPI002415DCF4|nr:flavin reductase family protein [Solwaraspora sp. WMMD1047]MDG4829917.1 flavin reductase family protein [Solwaraspora sp. WMMD1047]
MSDHKLLRRAFGTFATGITVVTVGGANPHGMTANSFASVSLDPPLVLVCVDHHATMHDRLLDEGLFGISVLGADQQHVARHFADRWRPQGLAEFDPVDWRPGEITGAPLIGGAVAQFECALWRSYDGGDHTIVLGNLLSLDRCAEQDALLFFQGRFRQLNEETR